MITPGQIPRPSLRSILPILLFALWLFPAPTGFGSSLIKSLTPDELREVESGETIVRAKDLSGEAWPRLTVFRIINAPATDVAKLFTDYESAPSYTPGMLGAEVINEPGTNIKDVRYTVKVPVLGTISYVVRNEYSQKGTDFEVVWKLLESPLASASNGSLIIEPIGDRTILQYTNHVTPSIPMAGALKNQARKEAVTTVEAIAKEAERRAKK